MLLKDHFATLVAVAMWILSVVAATAGRHAITGPLGRLIGIATIVSSIWALFQHYRQPQLRPGQIITSSEEMGNFEAAVIRSYREARDDEGGARLRSAS